MAVFKVAVRCESPSHDHVVEINARNTPDAEAECKKMFVDYERARLTWESRNVFCSMRIVSFDLVNRPWREVLMCLPSLEDKV